MSKMTKEQARAEQQRAVDYIEGHTGPEEDLPDLLEAEFRADFRREPHKSGGTITSITMIGVSMQAWQGEIAAINNWVHRVRNLLA